MTPADRLAEKREIALHAAARRKHGNCFQCRWRETTAGVIHCKGWPERQKGFCAEDGRLPRFTYDATTRENHQHGP
ncbi:hypothetical protein EA658_16600 [Pseudoxanthomonas winnipegensis]|uniref:Uncharacterized protein n=1 Tax=Pseudoxanthomonas winnipegensis TaxID=2480810 RepID=A0ABY1WCL2_9GAMM|nr:hypothetical protein [Pseudoxanthomonas winnipegensis]TAA11283.1 hypothetical protein EA659_08015 [Pseudoxanthomonas winnipegensis]TAA18706.1 hypothetical protein EA658_16600 [Pseudoxanthomonas winnipegensis]TAH73918.1 hypothetical protein EA657_00145 [Pseudoxanthomonas winnipegensis]